MWSPAVGKFGGKLFKHIFFYTLNLSKCLILILAFSILKRVQGPITVCYHTGYNICKSEMKSQFELENHGNVMKTKETGHSDVVKTFFSLDPFKISFQQNQQDFMRHLSFWQSPWLWHSRFVVVSLVGLRPSEPPFLGGKGAAMCPPTPWGSPSAPHFQGIKIAYKSTSYNII